MSIDGKFNLMHYAKHQRKNIYHKYERYKQDFGDVSLSWYLKKRYIPLGFAKEFHIKYMKEYSIKLE